MAEPAVIPIGEQRAVTDDDIAAALDYLRAAWPAWTPFDVLRQHLFPGDFGYGPACAAIRHLRLTGHIDHRINGQLRLRRQQGDSL